LIYVINERIIVDIRQFATENQIVLHEEQHVEEPSEDGNYDLSLDLSSFY